MTKYRIISETKNGVTRRRFVQATGAAAGVAAASSLLPMPAIAAERPIKLGYVSPQTGPLAAFGEADKFTIATVQAALKGGIKVGKKTHPVEIIVKDSQSNPNRAAEVATSLIQSDKINLMLVASTPETTNPVGDQCEINEMPCVSTMCAVAALVLRPRRQARHRLQIHLALFLGPRGRHRRLHQHVGQALRPTRSWAACSRTTATAMPGATRSSASRRCSTSSATS